MDVRAYNRDAWNRQVEQGNPWTKPVTPEQIAAARAGQWSVVLTPTIPVPADWFPPLRRAEVLCLASGGGQQGPILAAAGAKVTVFDNSPAQLKQDQQVAEREGLDLLIVEGDMRDLSSLPDGHFELIFNPVSTLFVPEVRPVWAECYRVLKKGGILLVGMVNPLMYMFDLQKMDAGELVVRHSIPYSDVESLSVEERQKFFDEGLPMEFSHTLADLLGGQMDAGFAMIGLFEDYDPNYVLAKHTPTFIATRSVKL